METSSFNSLCGFITPTTATVEDEPLPAELDPFKIPMKIVERVMNNSYFGDGTVHPGEHLLFIHELCELFKCADRKSTRLNSSHSGESRMPSSA